MAFSLKQLENFAKKANTSQEKSAATVVKSLRRLIKNYQKEATSIVADINLNPDARVRFAEIVKVNNDLKQALVDAGQRELLENYANEFDKISDLADEYFVSAGFVERNTIGGLSRELLEATVRTDVDDLDLQLSAKIVRPLQDELARSTLGVKSRNEIVRDMTMLIRDSNIGIFRKDGKEFTNHNIEVLISDTQNRFFRTARANVADQVDGLDWLLYVGPDDSITRVACQAMLDAAPHGVPGLYRKKEVTISNMNRIIIKQSGNVPRYQKLNANPRIAGGGFNCRHEFLEIDQETAKDLGAKI